MDNVKKEKLWNANYNRVMITNFTLYFSFYLLTPLLPLYLSETFHSTKDVIGMVLSGYTLIALLTRMFSGYIVDNFPRKKVLLVVVFIYAIFFGGYLLAGSLLMFTIFRTLHGGPFGATTVANSTMAIDVLPSSRRNEGIGFYGLSNNLASAIAPTIGIFLYHYTHDFDFLFWLAFIIAIIGYINTLGIKPPHDADYYKKSTIKQNEGLGKGYLSLDRFLLLRGWFIAINICFFGFCWGILSNYLAIYSKEHLGITSGTGTYFTLLSLGLMASRFQGNKSLREGKMTRNALEGILLSTIGYTLFIAYPSLIGYYGSAILIGLGNGHMWPAFQNMIIAIAHNNERGTANATILTSWDLGMGIGILMGGIVAENFGYDTTFWMMAFSQIIGFIMYLLLTKKEYIKAKL